MKNADKLIITTVGIVLSASVGSVRAQDWPQWRGPNRDGKLSGFAAPQNWPKGLTQKWKVTVGVGDSSPALVGNKLYAFGRQEANEVISCIDAVSGQVLWQEIYPAQFVVTGVSSRHPGTRSSPVVADGKLCVLGVGGILSCVDAATGKVLWRKQSAADYLDTACQFESSMSPIVVDGLCITYIGGKGQGALIAFELASGQAKWKYTGDAPAPSSPVIMTIDGVRQIVTINEKQVIGVSLADQALLWQVPFKARPVNTTTPVIDGQTVYIKSPRRKARSQRNRCGPIATHRPVRRSPRLCCETASCSATLLPSFCASVLTTARCFGRIRPPGARVPPLSMPAPA
jgi:outer membrane protein assembly factor BamB